MEVDSDGIQPPSEETVENTDSENDDSSNAPSQTKKKESWISFFRPKTIKGKVKLWLAGLVASACLTMIGYILTIGLVIMVAFYVENLFENDNSTATPAPATQQGASAK
jgi:hypothetical protein